MSKDIEERDALVIALRENIDARLSIGTRWMVYDDFNSNEEKDVWTVYEEQYRKSQGVELFSGGLLMAINILAGADYN